MSDFLQLTVSALVTAPVLRERLAHALAVVHVAAVLTAGGAGTVAAAVGATVDVVTVEVPVARLARVADTSHHVLLALTQHALVDNATAAERVAGHRLGAVRVAVALCSRRHSTGAL